MTQDITSHAQQGIVIFCGAGVSMVAPACLPSWWEMNDEVVHALSRQIEPFCGAERAAQWANEIITRRRGERFPPEFQAEIIARHYGASYFKVLQCLDGDDPNAVHFAIAALARSGHVQAVVTSNFDRLLEAAFEKSGVPLDVYFHAADFERLAGELEGPSQPPSRCRLLKLHGSVEDHTTLVDTLAQRMRGLPPAIGNCLQQLLRRHFWLFLGYSGRDLEGNADYLCLRPEAGRAVGFSWLVRQSAADEPIAAVRSLCSLYGERADAPRGDLPDWFLEQFDPFLPQDFLGPPALSDAELSRRRLSAAQAIVGHAREWSIELGDVRAAMAIADMLERSAANPQAALELLRATCSAKEKDSSYVPLANKLMNTLAAGSSFDEAIAFGESALARIGSSDGHGRAALLSNMGLIDQKRGAFRQALERFELAYEDSLRSQDENRRSIALHNRAMALASLGRPDEAMACYQEALDIVIKSGDAMGQAETLNNMGLLLRQQGREAEAIDALRRAIALRERLGDDKGVADCLGNIATAYQQQGQFAEAKSTYEQILATFRRIGDRAHEATTLRNLGITAQELGDDLEAERLYRESGELAAQLGMSVQRASSLLKLGSLYRAARRPAEARQLFEEVLSIFRNSGDKEGEAEALTNLAMASSDNDIDQSLDLFETAQALYRQIGQMNRVVEILTWMGAICGEQGRIPASLQWFDQAIALISNAAQRNGIAKGLAHVHELLVQNGYEDMGRHYLLRLEAVGVKVTIRKA